VGNENRAGAHAGRGGRRLTAGMAAPNYDDVEAAHVASTALFLVFFQHPVKEFRLRDAAESGPVSRETNAPSFLRRARLTVHDDPAEPGVTFQCKNREK
jgi:hypothetical protein